jgi:hypothetical protein
MPAHPYSPPEGLDWLASLEDMGRPMHRRVFAQYVPNRGHWTGWTAGH